MKPGCLAMAVMIAILGSGSANAGDIKWMAHRGGGLTERPDNTKVAFEYAWSLGGIPEADIRTTKDGVFICLHDETLDRTGTGNASILKVLAENLDYSRIRDIDVGSKFAAEYAAERVPLLEDVFALMRGRPERSIYLDLKTNELERLAGLVRSFGLEGRVYVSSPSIEQCEDMKGHLPGVKTLLWCGGTPFEIKKNFENARKAKFAGIDQVQLHLNPVSLGKGWKYSVDAEFVQKAAEAAREAGVDFQVYPKSFESRDVARLLEMDISWYVTDEPARFLETMTELAAIMSTAGN